MSNKLVKAHNAGPATDIENQVAGALQELESSIPDLRAELRPLQISGAREIAVGNRQAIAIFVPVPQLKAYHKIQARLTRELEKRFSERHVVFIAQRRILPKPGKNSRQKQQRPRSRTLKAVHEKTLEDLVFPTEIIGMRTRVKADGQRQIKTFLEPKDATSLEYKLESFSAVYKALTGKDVKFVFPAEA